MKISEFQALIEDIYGANDRARGMGGTFQWFSEEVGELARAMRKHDRANLEEEFADVFAWLSSMANMCEVDLEKAVRAKYPDCCIKCGKKPCGCANG